MRINHWERDDVVVLEMEGELLDGPAAGLLNDKIHELIDAGKTNVVVDLCQVKLMNSSGLGILIGGLTTLRNNGGDMKLANVAEKIRDLLKVTRLITIFEIFDSVEDAIESFRG